jgi:hypothetical protein
MENIAATRLNLSARELKEIGDIIPHLDILGPRQDDSWMSRHM